MKLPVTVLSGFLGAGKTTLLNHHGNPTLVLALLEAGADTPRRDRMGKTALKQATKAHQKELVALLKSRTRTFPETR